MNRRELLKRAGIVGGAGAVGLGGLGLYLGRDDGANKDRNGTRSAATPAPESPTPAGRTETRATATPDDRSPAYADQFETVVNAVSAGADPNGNRPINSLLEGHAGDDTLITFPAGTYRLRPVTLAGHENFGLVSAGDGRATFVAPSGLCLGPNPFVDFEWVDDLLLDGIDFDFRAAGAGGIIKLVADGNLTIRNLRTRGSCRGQIAAFRMDVVDEGGVGVVENLDARNHGNNETLTGIYVSNDHAGELTFRDCRLRGFSDNGLYASAPGDDDGNHGLVHTVGGNFRNNNISNVRLGSDGSSARGVSISVDATPDLDAVNLRGIRLRQGRDQRVEDCDIEIGPEAGESFGGIVFHGDNAGAYVKDTRITVDRDEVPAIHAFPRPDETEHAPLFENVTIDGGATGGFAATIDGRIGTVFRNCTITQRGANRGGVRFSDCNGCRIVDSRIEVQGNPVVLENATAALRNTTVVTPNGERTVQNEVVQNEVVGA
jgi:hypothetical protein